MSETSHTKSVEEVVFFSDDNKDYDLVNYLYVIAINDYKYENPLFNCINDAEAFINLLTDQYKFEKENVRMVYSGGLSDAFEKKFKDQVRKEATEEVIIDELLKMGKKIRDLEKVNSSEEETKKRPKKANFIIYYSGHGYYNEEWDMGYWIPVDAQQGNYSRYIPNTMIGHYLGRFPTHHTFLISDSCFSGSMFRTGPSKSAAEEISEVKPSRWGLSAGGYELVSDVDVSSEDDISKLKHSPFANILLEELRKTEQSLGVRQLCLNVSKEVTYKTLKGQSPMWERLFVAGDKGGEFIFHRKSDPQQFFEAGKTLMDLAEYRPEYDRYLSASLQFKSAYELATSDEDNAEFTRWEALALCFAGQYEKAREVIEWTKEDLGSLESYQELEELFAYACLLSIEKKKDDKAKKRAKDKTKKILRNFQKTHKKSIRSESLISRIIEKQDDPEIYQIVRLLYGQTQEYSEKEITRLTKIIQDAEIELTTEEHERAGNICARYASGKEVAINFYENSKQNSDKKFSDSTKKHDWKTNLKLAKNYLEKDQTKEALEKLKTTISFCPDNYPKLKTNLSEIQSNLLKKDPKRLDDIKGWFKKSYAVIIGISDYSGINKSLKTPVNDAIILAEVLRKYQGFQTEVLLDPTKEEVSELLNRLKSQEETYDRFLFYYAGHGIPGEVEGESAGYLLPSDANYHSGTLSSNSSLIRMEDVFKAIDILGSHHTFLLLDCCFAGSFKYTSKTRDVPELGFRPMAETRLKRYAERRAWQVLVSTEAEEIAQDIIAERENLTFKHSLFTQSLIDSLTGKRKKEVNYENRGVITANQLFLNIFDDSETYSKINNLSRPQKPQIFSMDNHDGGEFIFADPSQLKIDDEPELINQAFLRSIQNRIQYYLNRGNKELRLDLGVTYDLLGEPQKAIEEFETVRVLNNPQVFYPFGRLLLEQNFPKAKIQKKEAGRKSLTI